MKNIDKQFINIFDEIIKNKYKQTKHKVYYSNEYYLNNIFEMLNDINKWNMLKKLKIYNPVCINNKIAKFHFKTIENKYKKWCNDNIFEMAFNSCINYKNINKSVNLYIDSSLINNKYGIEEIGLHIDNKKKKASKISLITDENKFIYSILSIKTKVHKPINKKNKHKKVK